MTWFKVDDGFWSHPKTLALSDSAVALWVRAGSYACQHLTDGFVSVSTLRLLGDDRVVGELVDAGLWLDEGGGFQFHDWIEYQETSVDVKDRREKARERQRKRRSGGVRGESQRDSAVTDGVTTPVSSQKVFDPRPDPTRPDQTNVEEKKREDVERLCEHLQKRILDNGARKTSANVTDAWRRDARLLIDRDEVAEAEAHRVIDWCQDDSFWKQNILSFPKFRKQYDQLRIKAIGSKPVSGGGALWEGE